MEEVPALPVAKEEKMLYNNAMNDNGGVLN